MCIRHLANDLLIAGTHSSHMLQHYCQAFYTLGTEGSVLLPSALPLSWQSPVNFVGQQEGNKQSVPFLAGAWSNPGLS